MFNNKNKPIEFYVNRLKMESESKWRNYHAHNMPSFSLPSGLQFKIIPPFGGATCRFIINCESDPDIQVSVYFDTENALGYFGMLNDDPIPYWEIYPVFLTHPPSIEKKDVRRFAINDTDSLIKAAVASIEMQRSMKGIL